MKHTTATTAARRTRFGSHLKRHVVAYLALFLAVSMSPLPSWAAGKIGTAGLKNNAVTSVKIKNGQVKKADLGKDVVTSAKLGTVTRRTTSVSIANNSGGFAQVFCEEGEQLISGGASASGVGITDGWDVIRSASVSNSTGWDAAVWNSKGSSGNLIVEAHCLAK